MEKDITAFLDKVTAQISEFEDGDEWRMLAIASMLMVRLMHVNGVSTHAFDTPKFNFETKISKNNGLKH